MIAQGELGMKVAQQRFRKDLVKQTSEKSCREAYVQVRIIRAVYRFL